MVFSSYIFVLVFLPLTLIGYYLLSRLKNSTFQRLFLIAASLFFYGYFNVKYLAIIISSIAVNYVTALLIQSFLNKNSKAGRAFFILGVLFNVGLIGYYKYYDFFIENINALFGADFVLKHILLPLGISFFTFQQLSFLVSVYKREEKVERFIDYCLFVTFFPQLVAGPIVLYSEMLPQFKEEKRRFFNADNFTAGLYLFAIGMFKKAAIADTLALFADNGFALSELGLAAGWATSLSYTMQIFFDFSGYSDMAVGIGKMFNIELPFNFISPYRSESITEFWRRWHITLGRALSTYVYKPLGGSRKGSVRTCINLFLTFLVSGLWHGAAWTFVIWGALHGLFRVFEKVFEKPLGKIPVWLRVLLTFMLVNALWVLFRAESFEQALNVYRGMVNFSNTALWQLSTLTGDGTVNFPDIINYVYLGGILLALIIIVFKSDSTRDIVKRFKPSVKTVIITALLLAVSLLTLSRESVFIYFNF